MKKLTWILAIGIVAVVAIPAAVYAIDYLDEYEVTVNMTASSSELGVIDITEVSADIEPMDWLSFWNILKGHSTSDRSEYYLICVDITQDASGVTVSENTRITLGVGEELDVSLKLYEVQPGDSTLRIYVESLYTGGIIYDVSSDIIIG